MKSLIPILLISVFSTPAFSNHALVLPSIIRQLAPAMLGVVGGRFARTVPEENNYPLPEKKNDPIAQGGEFPSVVLLKKIINGRESLCSGIVIEGCILTADHCVADGVPNFIHHGFDPLTSPPLAQELYSKTLGGSKACKVSELCHQDLAIIRAVDLPQQEESKVKGLTDISLPSSVLATTSPVGGTRATMVGFGINESNELPDGRYQNVGAGLKRFGFSDFVARQDVPLDFGNSLLTQIGPQGRNVAGSGDSGGPLFEENPVNGMYMLTGITSARSPEDNPLFRTEPGGDFRAEDVKYSAFAPIVENRAWIEQTLFDLGCTEGSSDKESIIARMNEVIPEILQPLRNSPKYQRMFNRGRQTYLIDSTDVDSQLMQTLTALFHRFHGQSDTAPIKLELAWDSNAQQTKIRLFERRPDNTKGNFIFSYTMKPQEQEQPPARQQRPPPLNPRIQQGLPNMPNSVVPKDANQGVSPFRRQNSQPTPRNQEVSPFNLPITPPGQTPRDPFGSN